MNQFSVSFGYRKGRGAWQITEQMVIRSKDTDEAYRKAYQMCERGEEVFDVRLIQEVV